jgi:Ca2+-binding EF-hand superfamily protein
MNALNGTRNTLALLVVACGLASSATAQNARPGDGADRPLRGPNVRQPAPTQDGDQQNARPMREGGREQRGAFTRGEGARGGPEGRRGGPQGHRGGPGGHRGGPPAELIEKFDVDGDGQLNQAEREAAHEQMKAQAQAKKAEFIAKFDSDGDGELNQAEREAAKAELGDEFKGRRGEGGRAGRPGDRGGMHGQHGFGGQHGFRGQRGHHPLPPELVAEYDADGDGTLNEAERGVAREQMKTKAQAKRAELVARFDADGDGELNQTERRAAAEAMRAEHRQQRTMRGVDTNRDGKIDASELAEAAKLIGDGDKRADFNGDGTVDEQDLFFITNRAAGN